MPASPNWPGVCPTPRAHPCPAGTSELELAGQIGVPTQSNSRVSQGFKEFEHTFFWAGQCLKFVGRNHDRNGLSVPGHGLRAFRACKLYHMTKLILRILKRPFFHRCNISSVFWLVKLELGCPARPGGCNALAGRCAALVATLNIAAGNNPK